MGPCNPWPHQSHTPFPHPKPQCPCHGILTGGGAGRTNPVNTLHPHARPHAGDQDAEARTLSHIWDAKPGQQGQQHHSEPKNCTSSVLPLDTFLFAPIVQIGPLRLQDETSASAWSGVQIRKSGPRAHAPTMCCSALNRADFLEEGRFNSTLGLASLLRCKSGAAAREGQREDEVAPGCQRVSVPRGPGLHSGSIMELPVPKERRWACRTDPLHVAIHSGSVCGGSLAVSQFPLHRLLRDPPAL